MLTLLLACGDPAERDDAADSDSGEATETGDSAAGSSSCHAEVLLTADESAPGNWTILAEYTANPDPDWVVSGDPTYTLLSCVDSTGADCSSLVVSPQAARWDFQPDHADTFEISVRGDFACEKTGGGRAGATVDEQAVGVVGFGG
jgi:hypothetical protein